MKASAPPANRCLYCGRKCGRLEVCTACHPLPAADPLDPIFWAVVEIPAALLARAREAAA